MVALLYSNSAWALGSGKLTSALIAERMLDTDRSTARRGDYSFHLSFE